MRQRAKLGGRYTCTKGVRLPDEQREELCEAKSQEAVPRRPKVERTSEAKWPQGAAKGSRSFASLYSTTYCPQSFISFISGVPPQTSFLIRRRHIKKIKALRNQCGYFIQRQPSQPFGVRRAPSEPVSVISVVKNPASKSHFTNHNKTLHLSNFLSLFSNGDSPPSYFYLT